MQCVLPTPDLRSEVTPSQPKMARAANDTTTIDPHYKTRHQRLTSRNHSQLRNPTNNLTSLNQARTSSQSLSRRVLQLKRSRSQPNRQRKMRVPKPFHLLNLQSVRRNRSAKTVRRSSPSLLHRRVLQVLLDHR